MTEASVRQSLVEAIVAEVLRRLRSDQDAAAAAHADGRATITLDAHVVSLAVLQEIPPDCRQVRLPARAVVTPAARDELRRRAIDWVRGGEGLPETASCRVTLLVERNRTNTPLPTCLTAADRIMHYDTVDELVSRIAKEVTSPGRSVVAVHPRAHEVAWRANRARHVRAAALVSAGDRCWAPGAELPNAVVLEHIAGLADIAAMLRRTHRTAGLVSVRNE